MAANTTAKRIVTAPYSSMFCVVAILFILPRLGVAATMTGSATILSAIVWATPEQFRTQSGSLKLAVALVAFLWALSAMVATMQWTSALSD